MADIAHPSGLIASGLHPSPWPYCDVATTTTHKTLRGPRGGMILMGKDFENEWKIKAIKSGRIKFVSELIDSAVMPGIQGGPLMHIIAAKAVAFKEVLNDNFLDYSKQIVANAKTLSDRFIELGYDIVTNGTDTHIVLIDLTSKSMSGKKAEKRLEECLITTNKNMVPYDQRSPLVTSGIRIGTPALTTRGMRENEMMIIADIIHNILSDVDNNSIIDNNKPKVLDLCKKFPLYKELTYAMP
jgi:glycine hydroxymethyltransferase